MTIREAKAQDAAAWDSFVRTHDGSFLQSWQWGEVQKEEHVPYWRFLVEDNNSIVGVALVVKRTLRFGKSWLYVPGGTLASTSTLLQEKIIQLAKEQGAIFVRVDGDIPGWQKSPTEVQPRYTLLVDVSKSAEELLAGMHQKTRYNIKVAEKKGVQIRFSRDAKDLESFLSLASEVQDRSVYHYHSPAHYRKMLEVLGKTDMLTVAVAEYEGRPLAVHLLIQFVDTVTYFHGASSSRERAVMAPTLLQWESIKWAKQRDAHWYDFWGVAPPGATNHSWAGITRFKEGFGGERKNYSGAYDYPLSRFWYWVYTKAKSLKRKRTTIPLR